MPEYKRDAHVTELRDHKGPVLAMSAAGPYLFTGGADKRLLLYRVPVLLHFTPDKAEGKVPPSPSRSFGPSGIAHDGPVLCLAARLDFVVSGSTDGVLKVWKVESAPGSLSHRTVKGHSGPLWCVCFAGERLIATGSADATACLWETDMAKTARPKVVLRGHSGGVTAIADVPGAGQVVTGSEDGTVRIWTFDGMCPSVLEGHACPILALRCWRSTVMQPESAQRKDGPRPLHDLIFAGDMDGLIRVWDRPSAAEVACADTHTDAVKGLAMSLTPDRSLASVSMDGVLCLWRPGDMVLEREVLPPESSPTSPKGGGEEQEEEDDHAESHLPALTSAVLWSNIVVTSGWDGVVRCYVWNEE
jgi:WD40 repeat protein